jgi:hypothetical protein
MGSTLVEGLSADEIVALPMEELRALVVTGRPLTFRIGSATVLGEFAIDADVLVIELAHIDGGGEGVLPTIAAIAQRIARLHRLAAIEWLVYATNCARPNVRLRRMLERRGFAVTSRPGKSECYFLRSAVTVSPATDAR